MLPEARWGPWHVERYISGVFHRNIYFGISLALTGTMIFLANKYSYSY